MCLVIHPSLRHLDLELWPLWPLRDNWKKPLCGKLVIATVIAWFLCLIACCSFYIVEITLEQDGKEINETEINVEGALKQELRDTQVHEEHHEHHSKQYNENVTVQLMNAYHKTMNVTNC